MPMILSFAEPWERRLRISLAADMFRDAGRQLVLAAEMTSGTSALALNHLGELALSLSDSVKREFARPGVARIELQE